MNYSELTNILNSLGIKYETSLKKDWLGILCPLPSHKGVDKHFGNCSVNVKTGIIKCFSCGGKGHINNLYKDRFNKSLQTDFSNNHYEEKKKEIKPNKYITDNKYNFINVPLEENKFYYIQQRGYSQEFLVTFNIVECLSGVYSDYLIIPIIDKRKGIFEFEARQLKQREILIKYFQSINKYRRDNLEFLKKQFQIEIEEHHIYLDKSYCVHYDDTIINNDHLSYLLNKKVRYVSSSRCRETLWNIDNLNYRKPLYLVEGTGSIPKIWSSISKNVTATFGSNVSKDQIDYLKKFIKVIHIPDYDQAGYKMVSHLHMELKNYSIIDLSIEDTHKDYVNQIINTPAISPEEYISKYLYSKFTNK